MDDTRHLSDETVQLQKGINRLNAGDTSVRGELLNIACQQLMRLTGQLKREFDKYDASKSLPVSLDELFAGVSTRLYEALHSAPVRDPRHFYQIASVHIRRELVELCRQGESAELGELSELGRFYDCIDGLPDDQREVFELIWYYEMSREEVSELLKVSLSEIKRLWRSARLRLHETLDSGGPESHPDDEGDANFSGD